MLSKETSLVEKISVLSKAKMLVSTKSETLMAIYLENMTENELESTGLLKTHVTSKSRSIGRCITTIVSAVGESDKEDPKFPLPTNSAAISLPY